MKDNLQMISRFEKVALMAYLQMLHRTTGLEDVSERMICK